MAVDDWISNLFQSEQTRGLSGGRTSTVTLDEDNPYYNYRLRRHTAGGDLVDNPLLIWHGASDENQSGLLSHLTDQMNGETAGFTDVLLILSLDDYSRAAQAMQESWLQGTSRSLLQEFDNFCRRENFRRRFAHRQLGFRILCDGSADLGGQSLGLQAGEYVTGLLPNMYTGPVSGSFPVISIHLNIPGAWEGYQEIGRLYNDQILFTLGGSWLDNFHHANLREAALYRLQQYPNGSFVHVISPDLQDRYQVTAQEQGDASVLTLATREGEPLAYMVLALIESESSGGPVTIPPGGLAAGGFEEAESNQTSQSSDLLQSKTVIPETPEERIFTLQERGALLQKVHFSNFMLGYDVFLGTRGELGTSVPNKAATFQVRKRQVSLMAHVDGVKIGDTVVSPGESVAIEGDVVIEACGQSLEYCDLRGLRVERWPYVGEIRRPASSNYMLFGDEYMIGRSRDCRVVLPDEPGNDNIAWKPSVGEGAVIRSRTGDIPKSRFYTDSIMVGSEHAAVHLKETDPVVVSKNRNCYVYVRRSKAVFPLYPTASGKEPTEMGLEPGDEILVGNCLFHVGFTPGDAGESPAPPPLITVTPASEEGEGMATELADKSAFGDLPDLPSPPPLPQPPSGDKEDATPDSPSAAAGLGQQGAAPEPMPLADVGPDSIMVAVPREAGPSSLDSSEDIAELDEIDDQPTIPGTTMPPDVLAAVNKELEEDALDIYGEEEDAAEETVGNKEEAVEAAEEAEGEEPAADADGGLDEESFKEVRQRSEGDSESAAESDEEPKVHSVPPPFPDVQEGDEAEEEVAPASVAEPVAESSSGLGAVLAVDDAQAQFELGRRMQLVQVGWVINGTVTCGNHAKADLVIPENRIVAAQTFEARDYFELKVRGRKGHLKILSSSEILIDGKDIEQAEYDKPEGHIIDVIRRDDAGDEDFVVRLELIEDPTLPNPRSRLLILDAEDDLAAALVTRGLPKGDARVLDINGIKLSFTNTGDAVRVHDYLDTYKTEDGFLPFFVQHGDQRFGTAPEDGAEIVLNPDDHIIVGNGLFFIRKV